eukprot:GHVU01163952.1.p1 GENE.GHVU01163952.1~~GHVU01163952.1.p1  ORF type:complete len:194 (+),score=31.55 GHVU01163952.1:665-1246(+)
MCVGSPPCFLFGVAELTRLGVGAAATEVATQSDADDLAAARARLVGVPKRRGALPVGGAGTSRQGQVARGGFKGSTDATAERPAAAADASDLNRRKVKRLERASIQQGTGSSGLGGDSASSSDEGDAFKSRTSLLLQMAGVQAPTGTSSGEAHGGDGGGASVGGPTRCDTQGPGPRKKQKNSRKKKKCKTESA